MPRDVHIVPFHDANAWQQGHDGAHEGDGGLVDAVLLVGGPENEYTEEDGHGFPFVGTHLAHLV